MTERLPGKMRKNNEEIKETGASAFNIDGITVNPEVFGLFSKNFILTYKIIPFAMNGDSICVATATPNDYQAQAAVKAVTRKTVKMFYSDSGEINRMLTRLFEKSDAAKAVIEMKESLSKEETESITEISYNIDNEKDNDRQSATGRLVDNIIERAIIQHASDIHLEPEETEMAVRFRCDGILHNEMTIPISLHMRTIARIKVLAGMKVEERRLPQDGSFTVTVKEMSIDLRISTIPTVYGEKTVIRLLDKDSVKHDRHSIGLREKELEKYEKLVGSSYGLILITGPTGSGKSTTMYSFIQELKRPEVNIVTIEDPVEYKISGITQIQVNERAGLTFSEILKAVLRQDPDIICVGEIRDRETADIAIRAAITGHLVLSTLHTNDVISTFDRLMDLGVEPYLITSGLLGIISQRLVRKICPECHGKGILPSSDTYGCRKCHKTGYKGRTGIFEILLMDDELRRNVSEAKNRSEFIRAIKSKKYRTLRENCEELISMGITTQAELYRTLNSL